MHLFVYVEYILNRSSVILPRISFLNPIISKIIVVKVYKLPEVHRGNEASCRFEI